MLWKTVTIPKFWSLSREWGTQQRDSCTSGWPQICYVATDGLKLLNLLPQPTVFSRGVWFQETVAWYRFVSQFDETNQTFLNFILSSLWTDSAHFLGPIVKARQVAEAGASCFCWSQTDCHPNLAADLLPMKSCVLVSFREAPNAFTVWFCTWSPLLHSLYSELRVPEHPPAQREKRALKSIGSCTCSPFL